MTCCCSRPPGRWASRGGASASRTGLLFVAFAAAALMAFRNLPLVGFLAPVLIALYAPARLAAPTLALIAATGVLYWRAPDPAVAEWLVPTGAADFLAVHPSDRKFFNTYEQGGYWIWRGERVFIDGRALSESAFRDSQQILFNNGGAADAVTGPRKRGLARPLWHQHRRDERARARIRRALSARAGPRQSRRYRLAARLYDDTQELVFMRRTPPRNAQSLSNKFARVLRHLNAECSAYIEHSPDTPLCARTLADYWIRNPAWDPARHMCLPLYLARRGDRPPEAALRRLLAQPGPAMLLEIKLPVIVAPPRAVTPPPKPTKSCRRLCSR